MKTIKLKRALLIVALSIISLPLLKAQSDANFGNDPDVCKVKLSTYTEFFKQENFKDAFPAWRWCFYNCPASTKNLYIHGPTIIDYVISNAPTNEIKEKYIDTLLLVYDQRIQYFGEEGRVIGRKANDLLKYRPDNVNEAYEMYKRSIELMGDKTENSVMGYFTNVTIIMFKNGTLSKETVVENYSTVSEIIEHQLKEMGDDPKAERLRDLGNKIEEMFVNSGAADCEAIVSIFTPKFKQHPDDVELLTKIAKLIEKTRSQDCLTTDLYAKVSEALYNIEKTSEAAHKIAKVYYIKGVNDKAEFYYLEAIKLQSDESLKADIYYELASLYFSAYKNYPRARDYARRAIASNANYGKAYILIGRCYALGGSSCGETEIDKAAIYWIAVDQFVKARAVDASVADEANELIRRYTSFFPTREKAFWYSISEGQAYTVACWINENTTVRFID